MKIGIIREGKTPPDARVPLTPTECAFVNKNFPVNVVVERSLIRCFEDEEFEHAGISLTTDLTDCDVLMGVKEVPIWQLIPGKTYFFFSHTIKQQPHNRKLLQAILDKNIRLIDYEVLKDAKDARLIAFGKFAGMVGSHNALWTLGTRSGAFDLPRMKDCKDYSKAKAHYARTEFPPVKIVVTGTGRGASGAVEVLRDMGILQVSTEDFLQKNSMQAVFTQVSSAEYVRRKDGLPFKKEDFYQHPEAFESAFSRFYRSADIFINCIYFDNRAPAFFSVAEMALPEFRISVIADVTCDIVPFSSIPSTIRTSTIADPVFGFDPRTGKETAPFLPGSIDVMSIDNLPNEMPRDASAAFGRMFIEHILPELLKPESHILEGGTIAENGELGKHFQYLREYVGEPEMV